MTVARRTAYRTKEVHGQKDNILLQGHNPPARCRWIGPMLGKRNFACLQLVMTCKLIAAKTRRPVRPLPPLDSSPRWGKLSGGEICNYMCAAGSFSGIAYSTPTRSEIITISRKSNRRSVQQEWETRIAASSAITTMVRTRPQSDTPPKMLCKRWRSIKVQSVHYQGLCAALKSLQGVLSPSACDVECIQKYSAPT